MEKKIIQLLEVPFYQETLDNGLTVYLLPDERVNNFYANFVTRFGSKDLEFTPKDSKKSVQVPPGIAHFLEHKAFEQESGIEPFDFFSQHGASANAGTYTDRTAYEFYSAEDLEENLNFLLDFVQSPYFTEENIQKEKGIIEQEINMNIDDPAWVLNETLRANVFQKDFLRYPIAGKVSDIMGITKKQLEDCYKTFYHPSNMFLVMTGHFNPEKVIDIIRKNQAKKKFGKPFEIKRKTIKEPEEVKEKLTKVCLATEIPKFNYGIKLKRSRFDFVSAREQYYYFNMILELLLGMTSDFYEQATKDGLLAFPIECGVATTDDYYLLEMTGETENPKEVVTRMKAVLQSISITEEEVERMKRSFLSKYVYRFDNIVSLNRAMMGAIVRYHDILTDEVDLIRNLNMDDLQKIIAQFDLKNESLVLVHPNR